MPMMVELLYVLKRLLFTADMDSQKTRHARM